MPIDLFHWILQDWFIFLGTLAAVAFGGFVFYVRKQQ